MKNQKLPSLVTIAILSVITIFIWIGLDVYRALTTKKIPDVPPEILSPINPELNIPTLDKVQERVYVDESSLVKTKLSGEIPESTPAPRSTPISTSTPAPISSPTPQSSQ